MPRHSSRTSVATATATSLGLLSALHVLWGRGSTFPFRNRHDLDDQVIGRQVSPSPAACNTVACLLAIAAVSVARAAVGSSTTSKIAAVGGSVVLAVRAGLGFSGRTDILVPGSTSASFRRNDRRVFAPVCAALAVGAAYAATGPRQIRPGRAGFAPAAA